RFVADRNERFAIREPLTVAIANAVGNAVLARSTLPQREREELATRLDGEAVARRVYGEAGEVVRGVDELARRLRARRRHVDRQSARRIRRRIEQPDVSAALIHNAPSVGLRAACVKLVVVGVPARIGSIRTTRIQ